MADLIDRQKLLAKKWDWCDAEDAINSMPTIEAAPVVHARWMQDDTLKDLYFCSKCLTRDHRKPKHKFCPDCGARMDADAPERGEGSGQ